MPLSRPAPGLRRPPRAARRRLRPALAPLTLLLLSAWSQAAVFIPNSPADPPTGGPERADRDEPAASSGTEPLGSGIQWRLGPWRLGGTASLDLRHLRQDAGLRSSNRLLMADVDAASYIWQPWFAQLNVGLGFIVGQGRDSSVSSTADNATGGSRALTGRIGLSVFPASRFPFEVRADVSDSRGDGLALVGEQRSRRLSLSQGWRPVQGNDQLQLQLDHSTLQSGALRDTLLTLSATAVRQLPQHQFELGLSHVAHERDEHGESNRLSSLRIHHGFHPHGGLQVETLASWHRAEFARFEQSLGSDTRQVSSFATWRPTDWRWLPAGGTPLVAASVRWVQLSTTGSDERSNRSSSDGINASLGVSHDWGSSWRASLSGSASWLRSGQAPVSHAFNASGLLSWSPPGWSFGEWRYMPSAVLNVALGVDSLQGQRRQLGVQGGHSLSRDLALSGQTRLTWTLTQTAATLLESSQRAASTGLAHAVGISWQSLGTSGSQSYAALSVSDSRTMGETRGSFTLLNLQLSQRMPLGRYASWSANGTVQASRNASVELDPFTGLQRRLAPGWQPFYSISASYEQQRVFDVPRLRAVLLLGGTSQQLEQRALGDIDAPRERLSASAEARLEYAVGRLEARLAARAARVDGRLVAAVQARLQRRF